MHLWWYGLSYALGFLQIFLFARRHRAELGLTLADVYTLNLAMAALGVVLLVRSRKRRLGLLAPSRVHGRWGRTPRDGVPRPWQRLALVALLVFCLTIPSNWTQDVPAHYDGRHDGLHHSWLYPAIDTAPPALSTKP